MSLERLVRRAKLRQQQRNAVRNRGPVRNTRAGSTVGTKLYQSGSNYLDGTKLGGNTVRMQNIGRPGRAIYTSEEGAGGGVVVAGRGAASESGGGGGGVTIHSELLYLVTDGGGNKVNDHPQYGVVMAGWPNTNVYNTWTWRTKFLLDDQIKNSTFDGFRAHYVDRTVLSTAHTDDNAQASKGILVSGDLRTEAYDGVELSLNRGIDVDWTGTHRFVTHDVSMAQNLLFTSNNQKISSAGTGAFTLEAASDITVKPKASGDVLFANNSRVRSSNYEYHNTGWAVDGEGQADFRNVFANEFHAEVFIADENLVLQSLLSVAKSSGILAEDFAVPAVGSYSDGMVVNNSPNFTGRVFADNDTVMLYSATWSNVLGDQTLVIEAAYGEVSNYTDNGDGTQTWRFTRLAGSAGGTLTGTVPAGAVIIDYGEEGDGSYEIAATTNSTDGLTNYGPYARTKVWDSDSVPSGGSIPSPRYGRITTIQGNLRQVTNVTEWGLYGKGDETAVSDADDEPPFGRSRPEFKVSNLGLKMTNADIASHSVDSAGDMRQTIYMGSEGEVRFGWDTSTADELINLGTPYSTTLEYPDTGFWFRPGDPTVPDDADPPTLRVGTPMGNMSWLPPGQWVDPISGDIENRKERLSIIGRGERVWDYNGQTYYIPEEKIIFETDGDSYFSGTMKIGIGGEIRQGDGRVVDEPSYPPSENDFTGIRIRRATWRPAGPNGPEELAPTGAIVGSHYGKMQWQSNEYGRFEAGSMFVFAYRDDLDFTERTVEPASGTVNPKPLANYESMVVMGERGIHVKSYPLYMQALSDNGEDVYYFGDAGTQAAGIEFMDDTKLAYGYEDWGLNEVDPVAKIFSYHYGQTLPGYPERPPDENSHHAALVLVGPGDFDDDNGRRLGIARMDKLYQTADGPPMMEMGFWPELGLDRHVSFRSVDTFRVFFEKKMSLWHNAGSKFEIEVDDVTGWSTVRMYGQTVDIQGADVGSGIPESPPEGDAAVVVAGWSQFGGDVVPDIGAPAVGSDGRNLGSPSNYYNTLYVRNIVGATVLETVTSPYGQVWTTPDNFYIQTLDHSQVRTVYIQRDDYAPMNLHVAGNITVGLTGTIDGVDLAGFKSSFDSHLSAYSSHLSAYNSHISAFNAHVAASAGYADAIQDVADDLDAHESVYSAHAANANAHHSKVHALGGSDHTGSLSISRIDWSGFNYDTFANNLDHGQLSGKGDDDHTRYVDTVNARTITARHTFNPTSPLAPFIIGANAYNQVVNGLRAHYADRLYRTVYTGSGLSGGGMLTSDLTIQVGQGDGIAVASSSVGVDSTVARSDWPIIAGDGLGEGGNLALTGVTLSVGQGDGIGVSGTAVNVDETVARDSWPVIAGAGLTDGGNLALAGVTLNIGEGDGIAIGANDVSVDGSVARDTWRVSAGEGLSGGGALSSTEPPTLEVNETFPFNWSNTHTFGANILLGGDILPTSPDFSSLGSSLKPFGSSWISKINSTIFAEYTQQLIGQMFMIPPGMGILMAAVEPTDTTARFGQTMTPGDIVVIRSHVADGVTTATEYMQVGTLVTGSEYNVTRDLAGVHDPDPDWPDGTVYSILGHLGQGRIEFNNVDKPLISLLEQGATYDAQTEFVRIGDLNGVYTYTSGTNGLAITKDNTETDLSLMAGILFDPTNGVRVYNSAIAMFGPTNQTALIDADGNMKLGSNIATPTFEHVASTGLVRLGLTGGANATFDGSSALSINDASLLVGNVFSVDASGNVKMGSNISTPSFEHVASSGLVRIGLDGGANVEFDGSSALSVNDALLTVGDFFQVDPSAGAVIIGTDGGGQITFGGLGLDVYNANLTVGNFFSVDGTTGDLRAGLNVSAEDTTAFFVDVSESDVYIGKKNKGHLWWDQSDEQLKLYDGATDTTRGYIDTDGSMVFGDGELKLDEVGLTFSIPSSTAISSGSSLEWNYGANTMAYIGAFMLDSVPLAPWMLIRSGGNGYNGTISMAAKDSSGDNQTYFTMTTSYASLSANSGGSIYVGGGGVGIGTSAPDAPLHVLSSSARLARFERYGTTHDNRLDIRMSQDSTGGASHSIYMQASGAIAGDMLWRAANSGDMQMVLKNNGDVGIGTSNPGSRLDITGHRNDMTIQLTNRTNDTNWTEGDDLGAIEFYSADGSGAGSGARCSIRAVNEQGVYGGMNGLTFHTSGTAAASGGNFERMRINRYGNVGIGTSAPAANLDIEGSSNPSTIKLGSATSNAVFMSPANVFIQIDSDNNATDQRFEVRHNGTSYSDGTALFTVKESGNVGIGTASPVETLTINGNGWFTNGSFGGLGTAAGTGVRIGYSPSADAGLIYAYNYAGGSAKDLALNSPGGNVGIGTTSPSDLLHLYSTLPIIRLQDSAGGGAYAKVSGNSNYGSLILQADAGNTSIGSIVLYSGSTEVARVYGSNNYFGIGDTSPDYKLDVVGDINATGEVRNSGVALSSDIRLKTNVETITDALSTVMSLRGVHFEWDKNNKQAPRKDGTQTGFIAQEVEQVMPDVVSDWKVATGETESVIEDGRVTERHIKSWIKSVDYARIVPMAVMAIQELNKQVIDLQRQVEELRKN
jgi:hypothetical protein